MEQESIKGWPKANGEAVQAIVKKVKAGDDPFQLDKAALLAEYKNSGHMSAEEFSFNHAFAWHALHHKLDDTESKQALFLLVLECVLENG
ncbi:hypothetical protein [Sediminicola luteus]|uniref:Uncharacterized protein n=1 Tax=Sediminicola luteus TaxID=319238 RepID=A0A2A4G2I6_9FLAO|nr:hypothetical protein [Sediminicola luteus]PCE62641.1 hypothetical protein B7P33_18585 [Sediminicola luteus]